MKMKKMKMPSVMSLKVCSIPVGHLCWALISGYKRGARVMMIDLLENKGRFLQSLRRVRTSCSTSGTKATGPMSLAAIILASLVAKRKA